MRDPNATDPTVEDRTVADPDVTDPNVTGSPRRRLRRRLVSRVSRPLAALPLRVRLVALLVSLLLIALTLTSIATSALMSRQLIDSADRDLKEAALPTARQVLSRYLDPHEPPIPTTYVVRFMPTDGSKPLEEDPFPFRGSLRPDIPNLTLSDPRVNGPLFTVNSFNGDMRWRVVAGTLSDRSATFAVAVPLRGVDTTVRRTLELAILIGLAVMVSCAILGWFGIRRAFRPLAQIEDTAAAIAAGDLTRRIPVPAAQDEVSSLSRSLNAMLAQIEQSFAARKASEGRMRQFVADASHELRTPLAAVRGYAELYRQGAVSTPADVSGTMRRIEDESIRMGVLVDDLLLLTRLDSQRPLERAPVDLTVLAADAVQDVRALDPTRAVRLLGLSGDLEPTVIDGDESRLRQVVTNLVANAVNHTPAGTGIEIAVGSRTSGRARLEVRDHGPGVDPDRARKVFERFYRADPSRVRGSGGGNGLGLAIVAAIVDAHNGQVGVAATPGGGATFVVELPTANSQPEPSVV